jgi:hypothetical protein
MARSAGSLEAFISFSLTLPASFVILFSNLTIAVNERYTIRVPALPAAYSS